MEPTPVDYAERAEGDLAPAEEHLRNAKKMGGGAISPTLQLQWASTYAALATANEAAARRLMRL